jgi:hypothetical protein
MAAPIQDEAKKSQSSEKFYRFNSKISNVPRECPTIVTRVALWAAIEDWTAERMSFAVLECRLSQHNFQLIGHLAYSACAVAKPLWTSIERSKPGKNSGFNGSKTASRSVLMDSLHTRRKNCELLLNNENTTLTLKIYWFLDELRWRNSVTARSRRTL